MNFLSDKQALVSGFIAGVLMASDRVSSVDSEVDDEGNYTNRIVVDGDLGRAVIYVYSEADDEDAIVEHLREIRAGL